MYLVNGNVIFLDYEFTYTLCCIYINDLWFYDVQVLFITPRFPGRSRLILILIGKLPLVCNISVTVK